MFTQQKMRPSLARSLSIVAVVAAAGGASSAHAQFVQTINLTDFNNISQLQLNGTSTQTPGLPGEQSTLSLTLPATATTGGSQIGTFYHQNRQRVDLGFVSEFTFRMRDRSGVGADGLTFIIQNQGVNAMGAGGGALGFGTNLAFPTLGTGISNSLAVVFDTWDNSANWPTIPGAAVLSVQSNGLLPNTPSSVNSVNGTAVNGAFNDQVVHTVRISYTPGLMQIFYDNLAQPILNVSVNLTNTLGLENGTDAFVGFTAATGARVNAQRHEVLSWQFSSVVPAPASAALLGLGGLVAMRRRR